MPENRINPDQITALKTLISANRQELADQGIDRIDAHYTSDRYDGRAFDEFHAYNISNAGGTIADIAGFRASPPLAALLEELVAGKDFFPPDGGGGVCRLFIRTGMIEHESYEYVTVRREHELEIY